jgi:hypothetical protein
MDDIMLLDQINLMIQDFQSKKECDEIQSTTYDN